MPHMSNRDLLALACVVVLGAALCGCSSATPTPASTTRPATLHLAFTGAVASGSGVTATDALCTQGSGGPSDGWAWSATLITPGNRWQISLDYTGTTLKPGRFKLNDGQAGIANSTPMIFEIQSTDPIADYLTSAGATSYTYYMPETTNYATVDASLESGTIDATFTPWTPSNLTFTIKGTWSCA